MRVEPVRTCPECGAQLPEGTAPGQCPNCLLGLGLAASERKGGSSARKSKFRNQRSDVSRQRMEDRNWMAHRAPLRKSHLAPWKSRFLRHGTLSWPLKAQLRRRGASTTASIQDLCGWDRNEEPNPGRGRSAVRTGRGLPGALCRRVDPPHLESGVCVNPARVIPFR